MGGVILITQCLIPYLHVVAIQKNTFGFVFYGYSPILSLLLSLKHSPNQRPEYAGKFDIFGVFLYDHFIIGEIGGIFLHILIIVVLWLPPQE